MFMKKIVNLFPVVTLEAIIDDQERINSNLLEELNQIFDSDSSKRVLSHKWNKFLVTTEKHQLGYTNFNSESLTEVSEFKFFFDHITPLITDFFAQLDYKGTWHYVNAWASVYPKGAFVPLHDHKPMQWSGSYYVKAHDNCGNIEFTDPKEYALQNEPTSTKHRGDHRHSVSPLPGMLLLFPSYLKHETMPNETDEDRIIISFNINTGPKGSVSWYP